MPVQLQLPSGLPSDYPDLVDYRLQLPVNPNYTWQQLTGGPRNIGDITTIGLHHDAYPKANTAGYDDLTLARNIAQDHINLKMNEPKGDAGFPYHIWIRNGHWYWCNDIESFTYGIASNNAYTVHICVSGDYYQAPGRVYDQLTDADRKALYAAIMSVIAILPNYKEIKGHCELNSTDCPGYDYGKVKADIQTLQNKLTQSDTWEAKLQKVAAIVNEINYLNNLIKAGKDDGGAQWALSQQLILYDLMKQQNLL